MVLRIALALFLSSMFLFGCSADAEEGTDTSAETGQDNRSEEEKNRGTPGAFDEDQ